MTGSDSPDLIIAVGQVSSVEPLELQMITTEKLLAPRVWARATIHVQEALVGVASAGDTLSAVAHNSLYFGPAGDCRQSALSGGQWVFPGDTILFVSFQVRNFLWVSEQHVLDQFWVISGDPAIARESEVVRMLEASSPYCSAADLYASCKRVWFREYDLAELRAKILAEARLNGR